MLGPRLPTRRLGCRILQKDPYDHRGGHGPRHRREHSTGLPRDRSAIQARGPDLSAGLLARRLHRSVCCRCDPALRPAARRKHSIRCRCSSALSNALRRRRRCADTEGAVSRKTCRRSNFSDFSTRWRRSACRCGAGGSISAALSQQTAFDRSVTDMHPRLSRAVDGRAARRSSFRRPFEDPPRLRLDADPGASLVQRLSRRRRRRLCESRVVRHRARMDV